jgi:hypothetical protein
MKLNKNFPELELKTQANILAKSFFIIKTQKDEIVKKYNDLEIHNEQLNKVVSELNGTLDKVYHENKFLKSEVNNLRDELEEERKCSDIDKKEIINLKNSHIETLRLINEVHENRKFEEIKKYQEDYAKKVIAILLK